MPEISEVERVRRLCEQEALGKRIVDIEAAQDTIIFNVPADELADKLKDKKLVDTKRWGKYFVLGSKVKTEAASNWHLGMSGNIHFQHKFNHYSVLSKRDETWPPKYCKLKITFEDNITLAYVDVRRLGRIRLVNGDPLKVPPISLLGFDPLHNLPDPATFTALVQKRAVPVKALLLDQTFSAGVGNWVADETLYQAQIHPSQYTNTLSTEQCEMLREQLAYVCQTAVDVNADSNQFPDHWLFMYRWGKGRGVGKGVLPNGDKIAYEQVGGRTSAYVPRVQRLSKKKTTVSKKRAKATATVTVSPSKTISTTTPLRKSRRLQSATTTK